MKKKKYFWVLVVSIFSLVIISITSQIIKKESKEYIEEISEISKTYSLASMISQDTFEKYNEEELLRTYEDPLEVVYYYAMKARYYLITGKSDEVFEQIDNAIVYAEKSKYYNNLIIDIYGQGLEISSMKNNIYKIVEYSQRLINILNDSTTIWANEVQKQKLEIEVYSKQLLLLCDLKILDKASYYYGLINNIVLHKDIPAFIERNALYAKTIYLSSIGNHKEAKEQAILVYKSLEKEEKDRGGDFKDSALMNIAYAQILLEDYKNVEEMLLKAIKFYERMDDNFTVYIAKSNLGLYYLKVYEYDKAFEYFMESIKGMDASDNYYYKLEVLEILIENKDIFDNYCDINKILEEHYYLEKKINEEREASNVIQAIIDINDELNSGYIKSIGEKNEVILKRNRTVILSSIILLLTVIILIILLNKYKNEVTKSNANEEALKKIIERDYLTGCKTKEIGINKVRELIGEGVGFTLSVIDIDNFKNINDTFGHIFGDDVLREVANVLMKDLQDTEFVIRFGGEEFILVTMKPKDQAIKIFETKRKEVEELEFCQDVKVTISQGAITISDEKNVKSLIEKADELLYIAKRTGKNKVEV